MSKLKKTIPPYEIELILAHVLQKSREYVLAHPEVQLTKTQETRYKQLVKRRIKHEPMAYILGHKEFYGLDFKVTKDTLIPRPETEMMVENVISNSKLVNGKENYTILDIGTGSGNIIISIANEIKKFQLPITNYQLLSSDISPKALRIAKYNAKKNNVDKKIKFFQSDMIENKKLINYLTIKQFNHLIIVANLPYLSKKIYSETLPNVKNYEPKSALLSGQDGLDHYKKLLQQIKKLRNDCSMFHVSCYMEISPEQKTKIKKIIKKYFPSSTIDFKKDLAGKWRIAIVEI